MVVRSSESMVVTLGIPLGILVFFSTVDVLPTGAMAAVDFLVPGVIAISVASTGLVVVAIQTAFERKYGVLKRLGGTPLPRWGFLVAKSLSVVGILLIQTLLATGVAAGFLGWRPAGGALAAVVAVVLGAIACTATGLFLAGVLRAEATLAISNALFLLLLFVSGVVFEAEVLPTAVAAVGQALPVGALAEALRVAFAGEGFATWPLLALTGWSAVFVALATWGFRWEP